MKYRELIKRVQHYSGFSVSESERALQLFATALAYRLTDGERKDFASQLPQELKDKVSNIDETVPYDKADLYQVFTETQDIDDGHAKKQIMSVWSALKEQLTEGQLQHIKAQLPPDLESELHT